ncbi:acetate--CoA ligase family protein [Saccharomonospora sp. CUA-673]|uniref:acetate--CoA ligase family protein n=1 Tax=Saccharomonospora sp. CUA-673 TaxID=1904969 RepID=UPI002100B0D7|nr:acetate--CoA ligase family protein [Saccharomonospora sp. CUA-673]
MADRAEDEGLELVELAEETTSRLTEVLPPFATPNNPLDVTGYVLLDRELMGKALRVVVQDPNIDFVLVLQDLPRQTPDMQLAIDTFQRNAAIIRESPKLVVPVGNVLTDVNETGRTIQAESGYPTVVGGIEHGMNAIGHGVRWSETLRRHRESTAPPRRVDPVIPDGLPPRRGSWAEAQAASFLAANGVPMVPAELVTSADEAVDAAGALGYPVVLKAAVEGLEHKSDIGGVVLGIADDDELRAAVDEVGGAMTSAGHTGTRLLVQPHRRGGTELLVGVVRDPAWGLTLAVALGGVWVELLNESALRILPVAEDEVRRAVDSLRGLQVLRGARGAESVDLDELARVIARIGALAHALGDDLVAMEVNPLQVSAERIEALDALITWRD